MSMRASFAACVVAIAALSGVASADVIFSDSVFPNANWPMVQLTGTGSSSGVQILSGGNPNEARQITTTVSPGIPSSIFGFHQYGNTMATTYTPSTQGAISSIIATFDYLAVSGQQGLAFALKQSTFTYYAHAVTASNITGYLTDAATLTAADFTRVDGVAGNPNFTSTGASMRFGIMSFNSTGPDGNGFTTIANVDNWSVDVVPAPGSLAILGLAAALRRRR
jgi:hypothetical protein